MKLTLKRFPFFFQVTFFRLRNAVGLKSEVSWNHTLHYLLFDLDSRRASVDYFLKRYKEPFVYYDTPHGKHAIVFKPMSFRKAACELIKCPYVDLKHVALGLKRGYWFLETPDAIPYPFIEPMRIERNAQQIR